MPAFHRLVGDLTGPDRVLRYRASEGLGALGDLEAVPYLIGVLEDPDPGLRALAESALSRLTGRGWGQDPGRWRGWWAEQGAALIQHRSEAGLRAVAVLAAPSYEARFSAARTLETLGFREGIPALIQALGTHELPFRWRCARSLEVLTGERFGLDPARWTAWWEAARAARLPDLPLAQAPADSPAYVSAPMPPVLQALPRLDLDPEGALAQRARRMEEERNALEARLQTLEADRDRLTRETAQAREALEASQSAHALLVDSGAAATGRSQERVAALEQELAVRRGRTESLEAEARKAALVLEGLAREREEAARRAASLEADRARLEAALAAIPPASAPSPAVSPEELSREREKAAGLSAALAREREAARALAEEAEALRRKLAERPEPSPSVAETSSAAAAPPPAVPAPAADGHGSPGVERELAAWRARHAQIWEHMQDYVIQRDDSLSGIARKFHTDVETLLDLNVGNSLAIRDRHRIYAGYRINVPGA